MKIKHSVLGLDANKALSFFISISAACLVLYFSYCTHSNALTYINIPVCITVYCVVLFGVLYMELTIITMVTGSLVVVAGLQG